MPYILTEAAPIDDFWRVLHRLADATMPAIAREVEAILREAGGTLALGEIQDYLLRADQAGLLARLIEVWRDAGAVPVQARVAPLLEQLAVNIAVRVPVLEQADIPLAPISEARIADAVGARIVDISETTRATIQGILARAWESGQSIQAQAQEIRAVLGLTNHQAASVVRYREGLLQAGESPRRVTRLVEQRTAILRRQRALNVARTETIQAANLGQQTAWRQANEDGLLADGFRRFWLTAQNEAVCRLCAPVPGMNAEGVTLEQSFQTPIGPVFAPTLHPSCRCVVIGRFLD